MDIGVLYTNIRNYLEESNSLQRQIIEGQARTNELLNEIRLATNRTDGRVKELGEVEGSFRMAQPGEFTVTGGTIKPLENVSVTPDAPKPIAKKGK